MLSSIDKRVVAGTAGGIAGALAMTAIQTVGKQIGLIEEQLPHKVERRLATQTGTRRDLSPTQEWVLAQGGHLSLGATYGAGYGWFHQAGNLPATVDGPLYGLLVYAINLLGVGPALHLTQTPWHEAPLTTERRLLVHLLYGLVTGVVTEQLDQRMADGGRPMQSTARRALLYPNGEDQHGDVRRVPEPGNAFQWAARMLTRPGVQGQLLRQAEYLIGYSVTPFNGFAGDRTGERQQEASPDRMYLEIVVADVAGLLPIPNLTVRAKLVDQQGDEVSTHQQHLLWHPRPCHYGRIWHIPRHGEYTLSVQIEPPPSADAERMPDQHDGQHLAKPVAVTFPAIQIGSVGEDASS